MKAYFLALLTFCAFSLSAQDSNVFLEREFWKAGPNVEEIQQKISEGHDPAATDEHAFDGVSYGIIDNAPLESIKFMLTQEGNSVDKPTHGSVTYLLWAAYKGNKELVKHLLELGSDPQMATSRGTNILAMAAIGGVEDTEMYDLIFSQGVAVQSENSIGANALHLLAGSSADDEAIFQYLADKGISWESKDQEGNGLFNYAARGGNLKIMKMCAEKGLDYSLLNSRGENALFFASYGRKRSQVQLETFQYLESLGLEVDLVNWEGKTPLHNAIRKANAEVVDFFLERGVNINQIDEEGNTVMINSAWGNVEAMEKIIPLVADINQQNHEGHSALTLAIRRGADKAVDLLIAKGADIHQVDAVGNNLLYYAFENFRSSREEVFAHIIDTLVGEGLKASPDYVDGNTLAHLAIEKNSPFLLKKAISLGCDLNHKNEIGINTLHLAAMKAKDERLIAILLDAGADKRILTDFDESAYELAAQNELLGEKEVNIGFLRFD